MNHKKQYNKFYQRYSKLVNYDEPSDEVFFRNFNFPLRGKKILDLGCGSGEILEVLSKNGGICYGIDISSKFINSAKSKYPSIDFKIGDMADLPYEDHYFDIVVSKYALQSVTNLEKVFSEVYRVLKPGGIFLYLSKHPLRQFLEKVKGGGSDYYRQETVKSKIFNGSITLHEPSHTLAEYLSQYFFKNFEVLSFEEASDFPASEQIDGLVYPTFFLVKGKKKA